MADLIFTPDRNTHGKKDYTGAFKPLAKKFAKQRGNAKIIAIDVSKPMAKRRKQVIEAFEEYADDENNESVSTVAFFCHGYAQGIQLGFSWRGKKTPASAVKELAGHIYNVSGQNANVTVPLYCCSTANTKQKKSVGGDGGFADELRDALCREGAMRCRVVGHTTVGHTTNNPHTRFFDGSGMPEGGTGGYWIARPRGPLWRKWAKYLRGGGWMEMPYLSVNEIRGKLMD